MTVARRIVSWKPPCTAPKMINSNASTKMIMRIILFFIKGASPFLFILRYDTRLRVLAAKEFLVEKISAKAELARE